jgi:hypothetical protein
MTLQQLAAETGCDLQLIRAAIRRSDDRPTPINKSNGKKHGGEAYSYYEADALRGWWNTRAAQQSKGRKP